MKKEILKQLKSDYEGLEIKPSADLWDRIDQEMDTTHDLGSETSFQWWKYAAVVLFLISTGIFVYFNVNHDEKQHTITKTKSGQKKELNLKEALQEKKEENRETVSNLAVNKIPEKNNLEKNGTIITLIDHQKTPVSSQNIKKTQHANTVDPTAQIASDHPKTKTPDIIKPEEIVTDNFQLAVIAEKPEEKNGKYIQASDLLAGREYEKTREGKHKGSYVRIDLSKLKPHFSKAVTLGVTIHSKTD